MNKAWKIAVVAALLVAVGVVIAVKQGVLAPGGGRARARSAPATNEAPPTASLPRLVDVGAGKCTPCKMMKPVLAELKAEYAGRLRVDVFDVSEDPSVADEYAIRIIPTQIFYDASGKELYRHTGYISKQDILAKWQELGVDLSAGPGQAN